MNRAPLAAEAPTFGSGLVDSTSVPAPIILNFPVDEQASVTATKMASGLEEKVPRPTVLTNIGIMNDCDDFPYFQTNPDLYSRHLSTYYFLRVANHDATIGFVLPSVAHVLENLPAWSLDEDDHTLTLTAGTTEAERSAAVAQTTRAMRATEHFAILQGWRDELYPVYGLGGELLFTIERSASALFGVVTYGCHLTAFVRDKTDGALRLWIPRRARTKQTYPGMLDNTVAGGIAAGESAFECLVREAEEEASLPEGLVREKTKAVGAVTYFHIRDERAGGETRLLQPEVQYVYDLEVDEDVVPKPGDGEAESFELMSVDEVQVAMANGEFKSNCALVLLDFFVRHGILTADKEEHYIEIVSRLHRYLEFPTI